MLAFAGSARKDSFNKKLLQEAVAIAEKRGAKVTQFSFKEDPLPFYDGDLEAADGMPANAQKLQKLMIESDLIIIASPEYNGSVSPLLKNAIDWTSRGVKGGICLDGYKGKTFLILSASPGGGGGVRGLRHLREILTNLGANVIEDEVTVPAAHSTLGDHKAPYYKKLTTTIDASVKS